MKKVIAAVVAVVVLGVGGWLFLPRLLAKPEAGPAKPTSRSVPVVVATARKGDLKLYDSAPATVVAFNTVTVRSRVDGELVKVHFSEGQLVKEGDPLFEIDPRPYEVQLAQAEGQLERDKANQKNARLNLERFKQAKDAISDQQIDTMSATVDQFTGAIKSDEAAVDFAKLQLAFTKIAAPISGRIGYRIVDRGNIVRANDPSGLAVITQLQPIAIFFSLPQESIAAIVTRTDAGMKLLVEIHDRELRKKLDVGELLTFDNQIDPTTGTIRLKAVSKNQDRLLFPNQFVNARLLVDTRKAAILVPSAAVQRSPRSTFVYVVKSDETVELREIVVGPSEADETVIEKGLSEGEVVVLEGVDKLQPGSKVTIPGHGEKKRDKGEKPAVEAEKPSGEKSEKPASEKKPRKS